MQVAVQITEAMSISAIFTKMFGALHQLNPMVWALSRLWVGAHPSWACTIEATTSASTRARVWLAFGVLAYNLWAIAATASPP